MTIQQAYHVLGLEGYESLESVEKQFAELYNDAHTRLVNEFDEARSAQIKQYIAELQEAITAIKDLPSVAPGGAAPETNLTYVEFLQLIGLSGNANTKQIAKALKAKQSQLQGLLESSFSPEMSLLAERERIRLEKAAAIYLTSPTGAKAVATRIIRTVGIVVGILCVTTVSALAAWKYLSNTNGERNKKVAAVREALRVNDIKLAYEEYRDHQMLPWLKDSIGAEDRQRIVTGFLDITFSSIHESIQENILDTAKAGVTKLLEVKKYDMPEPDWNYPWDRQIEDLAILIAKKKMEGEHKQDYKNIVGPCAVMLDNLLSKKAQDEPLWRLATAENTKSAYEWYKKEFPNGSYVNDANEQLEILANNAAALARATNEYHNLLRQADELFDAGRHKEALAVYHQANGKMPKMKEALEGIRKCNKRQEEIEQDDQAFRTAYHSIEALEQYLQDYPDGRNTDKAQSRINQLKVQAEKQAKNDRAAKRWQTIRNFESIETFETFIKDYPESDHIEDARYRITELKKKEKDKIEQQRREDEYKKQQAEADRIRRQEEQRRLEEARKIRAAEEKRLNCYYCKGTNWKDKQCGKCGGSGECVTGSSDCGYCQNGYGNFQCSSCSGYGKFRCNTCNGRGCLRCRSYGYFLCSDCNQTGSVYQMCGYCSGRGCNPVKGPCRNCGADGNLESSERCYH